MRIEAEVGPAVLSQDRVYRYTLTRYWDMEKPKLAFVGLNPSTADESTLDPTLRRCLGFAHAWGYGRFTMLNLFAFRATDPIVMKAALDPVGPDNNAHLQLVTRRADMVIACWGTHGGWLNRDLDVRAMLMDCGVELYHLGLTKDGHPRHPLYLPSTTQPELWT